MIAQRIWKKGTYFYKSKQNKAFLFAQKSLQKNALPYLMVVVKCKNKNTLSQNEQSVRINSERNLAGWSSSARGDNMSVYEAISLMIQFGILAVGIVTVVISIVRLRK